MGKTRSAFDLKELLNQRSKQQEDQMQQPEYAEKMDIITLDAFELIPSEDNFYSTEELEGLMFTIALLGVLQPLLVIPCEGGYRIKAGHRRRLACMALVEKGMEQFRYVPCVIKNEQEDGAATILNGADAGGKEENELDTILERLTLIMANSFRDKSDWEKMEEALQQEALIEELRKIIKVTGRTRTILRDMTGGKLKEAQMGRYKNIKNNLCPELMEEFKAKNINVSVANEVAGLSKEYQQQAFLILQGNRALTLPDVKKLKELEDAAKQIQGQIEWQEWQQEAQEDKAEEQGQEDDQEPEKDPLEGHMNQPEEDTAEEQEEFEPKPEYINSLCYSCLHYSTCHVKTGTVKECDTYVNKAEAEKTEEQRYSEEQDRIDRETKKELQRKQDEERMQQLPGERKPKIHVIRFPASQWDDVTQNIQTFLLLKDDGYKVGDELNMQEYKGGEFTGGVIDAEITYMVNEHSGLVEGFCIAGIKVLRYSS